MAETISYLGQVLLFNALFMSDWVQTVLEVWTYFECADSSIEIQLFVIRAFETGLVVSHPVSVPNFQLQRNRLPRLFRFRFRPRFGRRSTDTRRPFPDCALREKKFGCGTKKRSVCHRFSSENDSTLSSFNGCCRFSFEKTSVKSNMLF